jgi:E3 ubiquitin-protein ligase HERC2
VPNPKATSPQLLAMFEFVGVLFGVAVRTNFPLPIDLPSFVWKQLLGESCCSVDLEAVDKFCVQVTETGQM